MTPPATTTTTQPAARNVQQQKQPQAAAPAQAPPLVQAQWPDLPNSHPSQPSSAPKITWGPSQPTVPAAQPLQPTLPAQPTPQAQSIQPAKSQPVANVASLPRQPEPQVSKPQPQPAQSRPAEGLSTQSIGFIPQVSAPGSQAPFYMPQTQEALDEWYKNMSSMLRTSGGAQSQWAGQPLGMPWGNTAEGAQPPAFGWNVQAPPAAGWKGPAAPVAAPPAAAALPKPAEPSFSFGSFASTPQWKVGSQCEGKFSEDGVWYNAVVESISADGKRFKVAYTEYGNSEELDASSLRPVGGASPPPSFASGPSWKVGDVCEGCFTEDGVWYLAKIDRISADGTRAHVVYTEYGNDEELPFSALRPASQPQVSLPSFFFSSSSIKRGCFDFFFFLLPFA